MKVITAQDLARYRLRAVVTEGGCLEWQGATTGAGYGNVWIDGTWYPIHRLAYAAAVNSDIDGFDIHHVCRNRACFNTDHLQRLTRREHRRVDRITQCLRGHKFTAETSYYDKNDKRYCKLCRYINQMAWWASRRPIRVAPARVAA